MAYSSFSAYTTFNEVAGGATKPPPFFPTKEIHGNATTILQRPATPEKHLHKKTKETVKRDK